MKPNTMIDTIVKKYLKGKTFTCTGYGLTITYKVNVSVKVDPTHWMGEYKYINLNVKVIDCVRNFGNYDKPVFGAGRVCKSNYTDVQSVVRCDLNKWFSPMFSTYFYKNFYTLLTRDTEIRINRYTYC